MKSVLTIAGSDPGGGAGIQADLRVIESLGLAGLSAITALTVQNSQGVNSVHPVDADVLAAQIETVMEDATDLGAVKIGMLGGAGQVRVVAEMIRRFRPPHVVLDPVLASSGGVPLLDDAGRSALLTELMPLCNLVTPNADEAAYLTRTDPTINHDRLLAAGQALLSFGAAAVLLKGGHIEGDSADDFLFQPGQEPRRYTKPWVQTLHSHGTGCFLSAAIATNLAKGMPLWLSVLPAKALLWNGLTEPVIAGRGPGYPSIAAALRLNNLQPTPSKGALEGLYVLTDSTLRSDRTAEDIVGAALRGGAKVIQVRDKTLATPALVKLCRKLKESAAAAGAVLIVNDRVDVALASGADGVHLGPDDMRPADARRLLGPDRLIGVSVSTMEEARSRSLYASYLAVGAVFGSSTKHDAGDAVGVGRISEIKAAFPDKPIVAIGGINLSNIDSVIAAGADSAAVISAVVCAPDMQAATAELVSRFPA